MRQKDGLRFVKYISGAFAVITALAVFVPFMPDLPGALPLGNDESWRFALNEAVAQGLVFGRDVIYTYGPYSSIFTKSYHPATDWLMLGGGIFLGLCYAFLLIMLAKAVHRLWFPPLYLTLCASLLYSHEFVRDAPRDALFHSYPLLLSLLIYRLASDGAIGTQVWTRFNIGIVILFFPLGLLPLVKASFLPICAMMATCCVFLFVLHKRLRMAAVCALSTVLFGVLLWMFSGQPLLALPDFFLSARPIIFGYTEAMSLAGNSSEIVIYILASILVMYATLMDKSKPTISRIVACACFGLFFFLSFKEGFVRHDAHALAASTAIGLAALSAALVVRIKTPVLITMLAVAALATGYINHHYVTVSPGLLTNMLDTYADAAAGLESRAVSGNVLKETFTGGLAARKQQITLPQLVGTTDIYSFNQIILFANSLRWSPRPVFQSYQAYTPELAKLNAEHLRGANAPNNIVFRVEPIEDRLPALEDGASWPLLINRYAVAGADQLFLYLTRRTRPVSERPPVEIVSGEHILGSRVQVPATKEAVFGEIDVEPTLLGKLCIFFYKPPELRISVSVAGAAVSRNFRFIPGMAKAGFILSPLVTDTMDFLLLTAADRDKTSPNIVNSFTISPVGGQSIFWKDTYSVKLTALDLVRDTRINSRSLP
jgi:hypothetical protein